jgi:toxin ParE1/3/4
VLRVERRGTAYADLEAIFDFIWQSSGMPRTAKAFVDRIDERCDRLGEVPFAGQARDDIYVGLRLVPFESAMIAYLVTDNAVIITNVFYGGRDYETLLRKMSGN